MAEQSPDDEAHAEVVSIAEQELPRDRDDLPPIDFSTLIVSLRTSALMHLGLGSSPTPGPVSVDLALARQEIDLLGILEHKTRGNLSGEEERLLSQILFDVKTRYLAAYEQKHRG